MPEERRLISAEELAKHNTEQDCWIGLHGLVINVDSSLQNEHPGGPEVIYALAGKDATLDFEDIGHSDAAREWGDKLIVGYLDEAKAESKVPRMRDINEASGGSSGMGVLPLVVAIAIAVAAYIYMQ